MDLKLIIAGFGGQGVLFLGKVLAYAGLTDGKEVSWLPSYGPEMRGGTANCSVCVSDQPIGSPLVTRPNVFVAMNLPSLDKFIDRTQPGGLVILDSSLINKKADREDVTVLEIPATRLADEQGLHGLANIILLGKLFKETMPCSYESLKKGLEKSIPSRKQHLLAANLKAVELGTGL
ncbi:MAG: 2-oxoacid:acceptor oxidoreductase family protein [Oscillospiraceae bacterium]|jgi:2-oxoglutarate ferredoxin oxidoreductase subunit gamma|nr:2-oxoacid:acceptor oxidoreductase family protein [Oscillospiraceae bacterium]